MQEEWRPVVGFEGYYEVSNLGRLRTAKHIVEYSDGRRRHIPGGRLISYGKPKPNGYFMKGLWKDGVKKYETIHRIVATAFIPNPDNLEQINHKNGIKTDNRADNLEWVSRKYNAIHAVYELGKNTGSQRKAIKCVETGVVYRSYGEAGRDIGASKSNFCRVVNNPARTLGGFHWVSI